MDDKREIIIIVDDDATNLAVGRSSLSEKYDVFTAPSGEKLFVFLEKISPDLILLDLEMPGMNGFDVLRKLKESDETENIPVIILTAKIDPETEVKGLSLGAVDYITKPFSRELLIKRIDLHIIIERQRKELQKYNLSLLSEVDKKSKTVLELQNAILKTVAELVECRDNVTGGHIERTQHYLRLLIDFLLEHGAYTEEILSWDVNLLVMSSQLHDVGKISIKDSILMKPGKLTDEEYEEMKKHTIYGVDIIRRIEDNTTENDFLRYAEIMAGSHHERWDGHGYPYGTKGNNIPLQGRLMAIIDVYDALTNDRPYKKAFSHEQAIDIIKDGFGTQFDPLVGGIFLAHEQEFKRIEIGKPKIDAQHAKLQPAMRAISNVLKTRDSRDLYHAERMQQYLEILINAMTKHDSFKREISEWNTDLFLLSAQVHDVGKIAIADNILQKTEKLSDDEFERVKTHVDFGIKVIQQIRDNIGDASLLHHAETSTVSHHEKWDGTGYPNGLKGRAIPLQGRIMTIVDVYDALTTDRPQRKKKTHQEAVEIIKGGRGTQFDPELVDVFLDCEQEFEKVLPS